MKIFLSCILLVSFSVKSLGDEEFKITYQLKGLVNRFISKNLNGKDFPGHRLESAELRADARFRCGKLMKNWSHRQFPQIFIVDAAASNLPLDIIVMLQDTPAGYYLYAYTPEGVAISSGWRTTSGEFSW